MNRLLENINCFDLQAILINLLYIYYQTTPSHIAVLVSQKKLHSGKGYNAYTYSFHFTFAYVENEASIFTRSMSIACVLFCDGACEINFSNMLKYKD